MMEMSLRKRVEADPQRVFEVFTDFEGAAENVSGITRIEMLNDGPIGVGTRFRETRIMLKREATEVMEITDLDRPSGYTLECSSCGALYASTFTFTADGDATEVEMKMTVTPRSLMAKLMSPIGKLMTGPMLKCIARDLDDLAGAVEGGAVTA